MSRSRQTQLSNTTLNFAARFIVQFYDRAITGISKLDGSSMLEIVGFANLNLPFRI